MNREMHSILTATVIETLVNEKSEGVSVRDLGKSGKLVSA